MSRSSLHNDKDDDSDDSHHSHRHRRGPLRDDEIAAFRRDGVLVVDDFLDPTAIERVRGEVDATLRRSHGVDVRDLRTTGHNLAALSSTAGSGGVLDVFYRPWQIRLATDPRLFSWTRQLWKANYVTTETATSWWDLPPDQQHRWHPYGPWQHDDDDDDELEKGELGYAYLDRICYRLPTRLSQEIGQEIHAQRQQQHQNQQTTKTKKKSNNHRKKTSLQRSLTPHLDCCPDTYDTAVGKAKWKPIQCFVSLTDNTEPHTGGFECVPGFHREFRDWQRHRTMTTTTADGKGTASSPSPPSCIGEYTHMRPGADDDVLRRVRHVPVRAGSVVFWDQRIPHANAYRHDGHEEPRVVVYLGFLPPVAVNRAYATRQLERWRRGLHPTDPWIGNVMTTATTTATTKKENLHDNDADDREENARDRHHASIPDADTILESLPPLGRKLLAAQPWNNDDNEEIEE